MSLRRTYRWGIWEWAEFLAPWLCWLALGLLAGAAITSHIDHKKDPACIQSRQ